jgi:peptidoglycan hydrolase-like protein with peptidoglycan-binding domain
VVVASGAYNIVSPLVTRATERDGNGNWVPGHHMCIHYVDSWAARSNTAYTRDMRAKVDEAVVLANRNLPQTNATSPTLQRGSTNAVRVRELQELLNKHGAVPQLNADGSFGPLTEQAVFYFQGKYNLPQSGIINEDDWIALRGDVRTNQKTDEEVSTMTIYNKIEQLPDWARPTIETLVDARLISGTNNAAHISPVGRVTYGDLGIDSNLLRNLVITERILKSGIYNK